MSMEYWFFGRLEFRDKAAVDAAKEFLDEEGYADDDDNLLGDDELQWSGTTLRVDARGSMPYSGFEISSGVLQAYALHASAGEVIALNVEDGVGERYRAADGDLEADHGDELEDDEVEQLRKEYGWNDG